MWFYGSPRFSLAVRSTFESFALNLWGFNRFEGHDLLSYVPLDGYPLFQCRCLFKCRLVFWLPSFCFSSELPLGDTDSTSVPAAFVSFSSELPLGDTDSTQPSSPSSVPDFASSVVSLVLSVPSSGSLDFFLVNSAPPLVDSSPISSNSVAFGSRFTSFFANSASPLVDGAPVSSNPAALGSVLATDVIENS